MAHPGIVEIQDRWAGMWVAVKEGEVVDARLAPNVLVLALREHGVVGATLFRCPATNEPELVGLG